MAATGLAMLGDRRLRGVGLVTLVAVLGKSFIEAGTGRVLFESLYLGYIGTPVPLCHLGGAVGGMAGWVLANKGIGEHLLLSAFLTSRNHP
jgi:hypothetical protein